MFSHADQVIDTMRPCHAGEIQIFLRSATSLKNPQPHCC